MYRNPEKIKFFLYSVITLIFITIVAVFVNYRYMGAIGDYISGSGERPTLSLDKVDHVATKDGVNQWSLRASVVNYYQGENRAEFLEPVVIFFSEKNEETKLAADHGTLDTRTNEMVVDGNVSVVNGRYTLLSDELHYNDKTRIVRSDVPVKIVEGDSILTSDKMESNLDSGITVLRGNVKGKLRGDFGKKKDN